MAIDDTILLLEVARTQKDKVSRGVIPMVASSFKLAASASFSSPPLVASAPTAPSMPPVGIPT